MHATNSNTIHALKYFPAALLRNHVKTATGNKKSRFESIMFIHMCSVNRVECISLQQILHMRLLSVRTSVAAMTFNDAKTILKLRRNCQVVWTDFFYAVCVVLSANKVVKVYDSIEFQVVSGTIRWFLWVSTAPVTPTPFISVLVTSM
mgnify:FL=1